MADQTYGQDNSNDTFGIMQPAQNAGYIGAFGGRSRQVAPQKAYQNALAGNPMFGRPIWSYATQTPGPVRGPQGNVATGSGRTAFTPTQPGLSSVLPGYVANQEYQPSTFAYDPTNKPEFMRQIPRTIETGDDGRETVGTYKPHDFTPGQRFLGHIRQAASWQVYEFPPDYRNLLAWQQVQRYRLHTLTISARPLSQNDYFLGYQMDPQIAAKLGGSTLGYMGSQ